MIKRINKQNDMTLFQNEIKKTKSLKERIRLCAILAEANGHSIQAIAAILRIPESSVDEYLTEFHKENK